MTILTIAGSDSGGGAGIQADIKTISALGGFAASAITAVTVQNTLGVSNIHDIPCNIVAEQIDAVLSDFAVKAIKIGMINQADLVDVIASAIKKHRVEYVVVDPVMVATSGDKLMQNATIEKLKKELFPLATIITPNLHEAAVLLGTAINNAEEMESAAAKLGSFGSKSVLIKGGHLSDNEMIDVLWVNYEAENEEEIHTFSVPKIETKNLHGTGCTLSAAIAVFLAYGKDIPQAVELAKKYVTIAIAAGKNMHIGKGNGPVNHFFDPQKLRINNQNSKTEK
ncbi:MAG: bifunctional hydroxymethylpyrimidine kinase/phosphomethylpyrimidine kinase [Lentimicrobiaceae bacterium]|nr:bifunctional hydroxymethylpyrimidine kinase/phosphomethylpyrimidine kinase [Lentimicrobiaceae bacterium]